MMKAALLSFLLTIFSVSGFAATSSDVFINSVTPTELPSKGKGSDITATIGNRRDILYSLRLLQGRQLQALAALKRLAAAKRPSAGLVAQKRELDLRRQFYDQIIFSVDAKWNDGTLKAFLEKEFLSRAQNDINSDSTDDGRDDVADHDPLWKFYTYLSVAIRDLPEPREDLVSFIQGYVDFSTLSKPKPPSEYVAQRAYSNGIVSQAAHTIAPEDAGDGVERIVRQRGLDKTLRHAPRSAAPDIELRMHVDMTPPPTAIMPSVERN